MLSARLWPFLGILPLASTASWREDQKGLIRDKNMEAEDTWEKPQCWLHCFKDPEMHLTSLLHKKLQTKRRHSSQWMQKSQNVILHTWCSPKAITNHLKAFPMSTPNDGLVSGAFRIQSFEYPEYLFQTHIYLCTHVHTHTYIHTFIFVSFLPHPFIIQHKMYQICILVF